VTLLLLGSGAVYTLGDVSAIGIPMGRFALSAFGFRASVDSGVSVSEQCNTPIYAAKKNFSLAGEPVPGSCWDFDTRPNDTKRSVVILRKTVSFRFDEESF